MGNTKFQRFSWLFMHLFMMYEFMLVQASHHWQPALPIPSTLSKIFGPNTLTRRARPLTTLSNTNNTRVFIAVNLRDAEELLEKCWADALLDLIQLLGSENTFLSIYENDSKDRTADILESMQHHVPCLSHIHSGTSKEDFPYFDEDVESPTRRIRYMADVRNQALLPLYNQKISDFDQDPSAGKPYDRILWLNDVYFNPEDIFSLIFDTNNGHYSAACALDFKDPFTTYDTFALRDLSRRPVFDPWYPFFGEGESRTQILHGKRDVQVFSCWGGALVFDSAPFYASNLKFRDSGSDKWEASECCLIHADLNQANRTFVNTAVRVAYDEWTFSWLSIAKKLDYAVHLLKKMSGFYSRTPWYDGITRTLELTEIVPANSSIDDLRNAEACGWDVLMFLGSRNESVEEQYGGYYNPEHQGVANGSYWTLTMGFPGKKDVKNEASGEL